MAGEDGSDGSPVESTSYEESEGYEESEEDYNPSASSSEGTVRERMYHLESDDEGGWRDEDRHRLSLVRVPGTFLDALQSQVQTPQGRTKLPLLLLLHCRVSTCAIKLGRRCVLCIVWKVVEKHLSHSSKTRNGASLLRFFPCWGVL
jgi:hypothetical protein